MAGLSQISLWHFWLRHTYTVSSPRPCTRTVPQGGHPTVAPSQSVLLNQDRSKGAQHDFECATYPCVQMLCRSPSGKLEIGCDHGRWICRPSSPLSEQMGKTMPMLLLSRRPSRGSTDRSRSNPKLTAHFPPASFKVVIDVSCGTSHGNRPTGILRTTGSIPGRTRY